MAALCKQIDIGTSNIVIFSGGGRVKRRSRDHSGEWEVSTKGLRCITCNLWDRETLPHNSRISCVEICKLFNK